MKICIILRSIVAVVKTIFFWQAVVGRANCFNSGMNSDLILLKYNNFYCIWMFVLNIIVDKHLEWINILHLYRIFSNFNPKTKSSKAFSTIRKSVMFSIQFHRQS